jgi:hypothetical protein
MVKRKRETMEKMPKGANQRLVVKSIKNDEPSAVEQLMARPGP